MSKVIAFSGGCGSGKTTTIAKIKNILTEQTGLNVVILNELLREKTDIPIDKLRKSPSDYLLLQDTIIREKIKQECEAFNDKSNTVYLVDRAITDSIFYLENYVDKSVLSENEIAILCELDAKARAHANYAFTKGYSCVLEFEPLYIQNNDKYRPEFLDHLRFYEYTAIQTLNIAYNAKCFCGKNFYSTYNLHIDSVEAIAKKICKIIKNKWLCFHL